MNSLDVRSPTLYRPCASLVMSSSLERSSSDPNLEAVVGEDSARQFPYPELLQNLTLYEYKGKPYALVAQPGMEQVTITREMRKQINYWSMTNEIFIEIDGWLSWLAPGENHLIHISLMGDAPVRNSAVKSSMI